MELGYLSGPNEWPLDDDEIAERRSRHEPPLHLWEQLRDLPEKCNAVIVQDAERGWVLTFRTDRPGRPIVVSNPCDTGGWAQYGQQEER
ncbi:hypothetical protein [Mycolicibacterium sp. CR10]|uniref:hypothetical protein n=1 Tax=Mycolicibacterium sp. CR10 TaxID=2562314 RepID=UPI0010BFD71C|nr:hypothetical protein [Mycolicibacterium sp. CR10]